MMPLFAVAVAKISFSLAVSSACREGSDPNNKAVKSIVNAEFMRDIDGPLLWWRLNRRQTDATSGFRNSSHRAISFVE